MRYAWIVSDSIVALKDMIPGQVFISFDGAPAMRMDDDDGATVSIVRLATGHSDRVSNSDTFALVDGFMAVE